MKHILGISAGFHDAAISVIDSNGHIVFAGHSERYSKIKNDASISTGLINEIRHLPITDIAYYERPWLHKLRTVYSREPDKNSWFLKYTLKKHLG